MYLKVKTLPPAGAAHSDAGGKTASDA